MKRKNTNGRHGIVVAYLALFLAIGGGAFAASGIAQKNSVVSRSIKDSAVQSADVRDGALTGTDVNEASLGRVPSATQAESARTADSAQTAGTASAVAPGAVGTGALADDAVAKAKIADGAVGSDELELFGVQSANIAGDSIGREKLKPGAVGALQLGAMTTVVGQGVPISAGNTGEARAICEPSDKLLAGGFEWRDNEENTLIYSAPLEAAPSRTWVAAGSVPSGSNELYAWALCLRI